MSLALRYSRGLDLSSFDDLKALKGILKEADQSWLRCSLPTNLDLALAELEQTLEERGPTIAVSQNVVMLRMEPHSSLWNNDDSSDGSVLPWHRWALDVVRFCRQLKECEHITVYDDATS